MKKYRILVSGLLGLLVVVSSINTWKGILSKEESQRNAYVQAQEYMEQGLYQKAVQEYQNVLHFGENREVRELLLAAYDRGCEDGSISAKQYMNALYENCKYYPTETKWWEQLIQYYYEINDYSAALKYLKEADKVKVTSDQINEIRRNISNLFRVQSRTYVDILYTPGGLFTVSNGEHWGILQADGEDVYECIYEYISPVAPSRSAVYISEIGCRLLDNNMVVQAIYKEEYEKIRYCENNIIAGYIDGVWRYVDMAGGYVLDSYEDASAFIGGLAAVKTNGRWSIIGMDGIGVGNSFFEDIKLYDNGAYTYQGIIVAKQDDNYSIYDADGNRKNQFSCIDMDKYMGGYIAYQDANGLWGYVDQDGNIVITPQFEQAKSFSGGKAAVCQDGLWGFIDTSGRIAIDYQFDGAGYFTSQGVCPVQSFDGKYHLIKLRY